MLISYCLLKQDSKLTLTGELPFFSKYFYLYNIIIIQILTNI